MILKSILLDGKSQPRQVTYFITPLFLENMNPYFKKEKIEILNVYTSENIMCMYFTTKYLQKRLYIKIIWQNSGIDELQKKGHGPKYKERKMLTGGKRMCGSSKIEKNQEQIIHLKTGVLWRGVRATLPEEEGRVLSRPESGVTVLTWVRLLCLPHCSVQFISFVRFFLFEREGAHTPEQREAQGERELSKEPDPGIMT